METGAQPGFGIRERIEIDARMVRVSKDRGDIRIAGIGIVAIRGDPIRGYAGHRLCRSKEGLRSGKVAVLTRSVICGRMCAGIGVDPLAGFHSASSITSGAER